MWLHRAKVPQIASEMVGGLTEKGQIEAEAPKEVQLDVEAVLSQYISDEQELSDKARDMIARGMPQTDLGRVKKMLAEQKKLGLGEDAIDYLLDQLVEMLMHSNNVDEVFAPDFELRRTMREPLRKQFAADSDLEREVRGQLKHVQEGTRMWEIEYRRMMEDIKRRKGL